MSVRRKYDVNQLRPRIERFLKPILQRARLRLRFEITEGPIQDREWESPDVLVKLTGPDVEMLLENKAELLLALEHLTIQMLRLPPEDHERLCFDANDYRLLRIEELRLSASAAAERVRRSGRPYQFSPMTSRERRIIHLALRDEPGVRSESQGVGPARRVVVYPVPAGQRSRSQVAPESATPGALPDAAP
ncbi:MAG: protein jag [Bryobacteraceae bacterium]